MKTTTRTLWNTLLAVLLGTLLAAQAHAQIYVVNSVGGIPTVSKYNLDGTTVNASLVAGLNTPGRGIALSGNTLYVSDTNGGGAADGIIRKYDATTGAPINTSFVTGFNYPGALAVSGNNLYVLAENTFNGGGFVAAYDATTGASVNPSLITGLFFPDGIAISGNNLYVPSQENLAFGFINEYNATTGAPISVPLVSGLLHTPAGLVVSGNILYEANATGGSIGTYDATTGAVINASFISGLGGYPACLALLGNHLFVSNFITGTIGEYDATTGAVINASLISGLNPGGLVVVEPYSAQVEQPINSDGSSVFNANRGVVPVKFTLTLNGVATCNLPSATIALTRTSGGTIGSVDESVYSGSADTGSNFRISSCQYVYNLSASALGAGTYRVDILIDGQVVGSGIFQLK